MDTENTKKVKDVKTTKESKSVDKIDNIIPDNKWDNYSGLPNPSWYEDEEID